MQSKDLDYQGPIYSGGSNFNSQPLSVQQKAIFEQDFSAMIRSAGSLNRPFEELMLGHLPFFRKAAEVFNILTGMVSFGSQNSLTGMTFIRPITLSQSPSRVDWIHRFKEAGWHGLFTDESTIRLSSTGVVGGPQSANVNNRVLIAAIGLVEHNPPPQIHEVALNIGQKNYSIQPLRWQPLDTKDSPASYFAAFSAPIIVPVNVMFSVQGHVKASQNHRMGGEEWKECLDRLADGPIFTETELLGITFSTGYYSLDK